jgi:membrane-associated protease RseP (regulator of RpoE activity)
MIAGKMIVPPPHTFAPCFRRVAVKEYPQELGFDVDAYMAAPRIIKNLVPGSAAQNAGLREGDTVLDGPDVSDPSFKYETPIALKVNRDGKTLFFAFRARGKPITGYRWVRDSHAPDGQCKL